MTVIASGAILVGLRRPTYRLEHKPLRLLALNWCVDGLHGPFLSKYSFNLGSSDLSSEGKRQNVPRGSTTAYSQCLRGSVGYEAKGAWLGSPVRQIRTSEGTERSSMRPRLRKLHAEVPVTKGRIMNESSAPISPQLSF